MQIRGVISFNTGKKSHAIRRDSNDWRRLVSFLTRSRTMWQQYPYPPESRCKGDFYGRPLPSLPSQTPPRPERQYSVNTSFSLTRPNETIKITVSKHVDIGFCKFSQAVLATIEEGPNYLQGKTVFMKFYDPLFVNPDDLQTIPNPDLSTSDPSPPSSHESISGTTLAGSVESSRKNVDKADVDPLNLLGRLICRIPRFGEQKIWRRPLTANL